MPGCYCLCRGSTHAFRLPRLPRRLTRGSSDHPGVYDPHPRLDVASSVLPHPVSSRNVYVVNVPLMSDCPKRSPSLLSRGAPNLAAESTAHVLERLRRPRAPAFVDGAVQPGSGVVVRLELRLILVRQLALVLRVVSSFCHHGAYHACMIGTPPVVPRGATMPAGPYPMVFRLEPHTRVVYVQCAEDVN